MVKVKPRSKKNLSVDIREQLAKRDVHQMQTVKKNPQSRSAVSRNRNTFGLTAVTHSLPAPNTSFRLANIAHHLPGVSGLNNLRAMKNALNTAIASTRNKTIASTRNNNSNSNNNISRPRRMLMPTKRPSLRHPAVARIASINQLIRNSRNLRASNINSIIRKHSHRRRSRQARSSRAPPPSPTLSRYT